jgi:DNA (cytosine-5)-methyltransferase 1
MTPEERREEYPVRVTMKTRKRLAAQSAPWPTPTVFGNGNRSEYGGKSGDGLDTAVKRAAESATGPTPTCAGLDGGSNSRKAARARGRYIEGAGAKSATGPTPQATDAKHTMRENRDGRQIMLIHAIRDRAALSATGPTPTAHAAKPVCNEKARDGLNYAVERGKTKSHLYPTVGTQTMGGCSGSFAKLKELEEIGRQTPEERRAMSSHLTGGKDPDTANCGMLNPDWVEWLMGWPIWWTDVEFFNADGGQCVMPWLDLADDPADWPTPLMARITTRKKHRVPRIETLGNGQVPLCAAVAFVWGFEILRVIVEGRKAA